MTQDRLEQILKQLDEIYSELYDGGLKHIANALEGVSDELFEELDKGD